MNRTEIKFQPNVPVEVLLDRGAEGKEYPSKFEGAESRWYYTVNGNEAFLYLPTTARNQLVRTRAAAGDTVRICKTVDGKSMQWRIEVLSDATEPAPEPPQPAPGPRIVAPVPARTNGANALQPEAAPAAQTARRVEAGPKPFTSEASRNTAPAASSVPEPLTPKIVEERLTRLFVASARALRNAHEQLSKDEYFNYLEMFTWDDIRATAIHLAIGIEKREAERR